MLGITQRSRKIVVIGSVATALVVALVAALVGPGKSAHGQVKISLSLSQKNVEPPSFEIGPIAGLTTEWHLAPAETSIPLGTIVFFRQPAPQNANITWQGAIEFMRDAESSTAICPLVNTGKVVVEVDVSVPSGIGDQGPIFSSSGSSRAVLNVMDVAVDQITLLPLDVYVDPVEIDESLPQDELNNQTMSYFFPISKSIAQLTQVGPNLYLTSVAREITFNVQTKPAGFEPLIEWSRDGEVLSLGQTLANQSFDAIGSYTITVGSGSQPEAIQIDTYSVTITSHTSFIDTIPEGEPITFTAVTDPPGFEDEITWLSSTKYGTGSPVLGSGPSFTTQFDDTFGTVGFQWLGVRADNSAFVQDLSCAADLDIDSDNNEGVVSVARSAFEDGIEENPPGKYICLNNDDDDDNEVLDLDEEPIMPDPPEDEPVPLVLELDPNTPPGQWRIQHTAHVQVYDEDRMGPIPPNTWFPTPLVPNPTKPQYYWVEGVQLSTVLGDASITLEYDCDGDNIVDEEDTVVASVITIDLDVDSDNTNDTPDFGPDRDDAEDRIEDSEDRPGRMLCVNNDDDDGDGIPDLGDGYGLVPGADGVINAAEDDFVRIVLEVPDPVDLTVAQIRVTYNASNPAAAIVFGDPPFIAPAPGLLRIWTKNGNVLRNPVAIIAGGNYVAPGVYNPADFGLSNAVRTVNLWLEGIRPTPKDENARILFEIDPDGPNAPAGFQCADAVRVSVELCGCPPTSPFTPVSCGGPVDCPAAALPFSQGTASTELNSNRLCITGAGGLNISGRSFGAVLTSLPNSTEMTIFTTAPAMDVVSGGVVTSFPVMGTSIFCAGADCKVSESGDLVLASAFAITDTHISGLSGLVLSEFPLPAGTTPVRAAGIGTCGGGNVNFAICVETTGPTIECVFLDLDGSQNHSSFPIPAPIVAPPLSWTDGPTSGVLVFTNTTAIRISGGVQTPFALPGNFTGFIPAANGVTVTTTGGNFPVFLANGVTIVPFAQCNTPGAGSIAMNVDPCSSSIAAVSAGWEPAGVCCTPGEIQTVQGGPFGLCTSP